MDNEYLLTKVRPGESHMRLPWLPVGLALLFWLPATARAGDEKKPSAAAIQFFETKIRPLLANNCFNCHGPKKQRGELRLDSRAAMLEGGARGPALVPGDPNKSLLIIAIRYDDKQLKMPEDKKLPKEHIADLTQWVKMGAPWPGEEKVVGSPTRKGEFKLTDKDRAH